MYIIYSMETSRREHVHTQDVKFRFQTETQAPKKTLNGSMGKPTFSVEPMVYITGLGYDVVDIFNSGNEFMLAFYKYVQAHEEMGYKHNGLSSQEIKNKLENLWGDKIES